MKPSTSDLSLLFIVSCLILSCQSDLTTNSDRAIRAVNENEIQTGEGVIAISGARLIDVDRGQQLDSVSVIIKDGIIEQVGHSKTIEIPSGAEMIDATNLTLVPGLIDAHFHLLEELPATFLKNGITSVRDPGAWIESYDEQRKPDAKIPRLFLTGPHFDMPFPAYPQNSFMVLDPDEAKQGVNHFINQGASAIKVYFRCSLGIIRSICEAAHERGIPVTAHLEITDAREAILAGLDGIEHVTSLGTTLIPLREAEKYRQAILADNNARRYGRYEMWASIDVNAPKTDSLIAFLKRHNTFVCPTLGAFECRMESAEGDSIKFRGFKSMLEFIGKAYDEGVNLVVGSHSWVEYAEFGWAYHHELELLKDAGMTNLDIVRAATVENAKFFRIEDRLGSITNGKQADLILVEGNPLEDISTLRKIKKVMLNGVWIVD